MKKQLLTTIIVICVTLLAGNLLFSQDEKKKKEEPKPSYFSSTELHMLGTFGPFKLNEDVNDDDDDSNDNLGNFVFTLDHFSTWRLGTNYFFFETTGQRNFNSYDKDFLLYLEYAPALSFNKIFGSEFDKDSIIKEVFITGQINMGRAPAFEINRVWLEGIIIDFNIPGFAVFSTQYLARQEYHYDPSWQFTYVWAIPFKLGSSSWVFRGFLDLWQRIKKDANTEDAIVFLTQPQLLLNLDFMGLPEFSFGTEFQLSNAYPTKAAYDKKDNSIDYAISPMVSFHF